MSAGLFALVAVILLVLAASSALFSAIETSLFSLQPFHIERLKARRASFATALSKLMENPRRLLSAILLADAMANVPLIVLCLALLRSYLVPNVPFWAAALLVFGVVVFLCDLVPKLIALTDPYRVAKIGVRVMCIITPVFDPFARLLQKWSEAFAETITPAALKSGHFLNEDELETLVELSTEEGALHETESEMISEIIKLGDKTAKDCMTPRVDAFAIPDDLTNDELIPKLRQRRYRRVPVYGETPDDILGILDVGAFLLDPAAHYTERLVPPSFVPETMKAIDLMRSFLTHPQAIAIVVDEHGGTEGIVTLADIVEEIISDAVPRGDRELYIETLGPGRLLVNGAARLDDINELLSTGIETEGIDTIGGYVFNRLGTLPKPGAQLEIGDLKLLVRRTSRKRIEELLIEQEQTEEAGDGEEEEEP
jgi:putative hemolysin